MSKQSIIDLIASRDHMTEMEATDLVNETIEEIMELIDSDCVYEIRDVLMKNLGLEPEYLFGLFPTII